VADNRQLKVSQSNALHITNSESQWRPALEAVISKATLATLQCLVLAQIFCITKGDHSNLLYYNGVAVKLSQRLGLHQSQKRFSLGALTRETRKKVFWSLYTLDWYVAPPSTSKTFVCGTNAAQFRSCSLGATAINQG